MFKNERSLVMEEQKLEVETIVSKEEQLIEKNKLKKNPLAF